MLSVLWSENKQKENIPTMKKFIALCLCAVLLLSLCACGKEKEPEVQEVSIESAVALLDTV